MQDTCKIHRIRILIGTPPPKFDNKPPVTPGLGLLGSASSESPRNDWHRVVRDLVFPVRLWVGSVVGLCVCGSVWSWDSRSVTLCAHMCMIVPCVRLCARPVCVCEL